MNSKNIKFHKRHKFVIKITKQCLSIRLHFPKSDTHLSYKKLSFWVSGKILIDWSNIYLTNFLKVETYLEPIRISMMQAFNGNS